MFKQNKELDLSQVTESGCNLGIQRRAVDLFFKVDSVNITSFGAVAYLFAGISIDNLQFYGFYNVSLEGDGSALSQAETAIMMLDEFSGAVLV